MGQPAARRRGIRRLAEANPANRNIQVAGGEENKSDPPSSGERKGASPNPGRRGAPGVAGRAVGVAVGRAEASWKGAPEGVRAPYAEPAAARPVP